MPRSSIHLPHSGNRNTALHSFVFSPMRATRPSHPNHSENKISLSPRGLSKLHLSLLSELHEISVEAITGLYFHHLKIVNSSDFGFLICDAVLSGVHTSAKIYVVLHLTNTWQKHSPSRDREVPHFWIHFITIVTSWDPRSKKNNSPVSNFNYSKGETIPFLTFSFLDTDKRNISSMSDAKNVLLLTGSWRARKQFIKSEFWGPFHHFATTHKNVGNFMVRREIGLFISCHTILSFC